MACPRHPGPARQSEVSPAKPVTTGLTAPVRTSWPKRSGPPRGELGERPRHPVGDEAAHVRQVVKPDVLGAALLGGEHAQLPLGAGDGLVVGAVRVLKRDLPVARAVRDEERHGDLLHHPVQVDLAGELDELPRGRRRAWSAGSRRTRSPTPPCPPARSAPAAAAPRPSRGSRPSGRRYPAPRAPPSARRRTCAPWWSRGRST